MRTAPSKLALFCSAVAIVAASGCQKAPTPEQSAAPAAVATPQIGGQDVVTLSREATANSSKPEFLTATIFPGRGMNLFQITAYIPGKGKVNVFASPSIAEAKTTLTGDDFGNKSFSFGGAFLVPYANRIRGKISADGKTISTEWHGKTITLPANWKGKNPGAEPHSMHGLILDSKTDDLKTTSIPDGQQLSGVIHAGDFNSHWPSKTDLTFQISLQGDAVDATITAKNVGDQPEPMGIGWHPYFAIPSGDRSQTHLTIPAGLVATVNNYDDVFPTGKLIPVKGTKYDFNPPGKELGDIFLDDNFSHLTRTDGAVVVDVADPASNYGIHVKGVSSEIKFVQVYAPIEKPFVAVEQQLNAGDPFGKEWNGADAGMVTLKPGESVTWHSRLELFTPSK